MSTTLADSKTSMMSKEKKDAQWKKMYMESLINPFTTTPVKILDGEIRTTAAVKLRATGEIVCSSVGVTNVLIFPGLTNVLCWSSTPDDVFTTPVANMTLDGATFKSHLSLQADRDKVRVARLTGAGARFFLTNNTEESDGYWEAVRVSNYADYMTYEQTTATNGDLGYAVHAVRSTDYPVVSNSTYQFGQLRDIHKFVFKLNSTDNDHKFNRIDGTTGLESSDKWDAIFIKIRGRRDAATPSILRFDTVANQEVVYSEISALARMMDSTPRDNEIEKFLEYSRIDLPAFKVSP